MYDTFVLLLQKGAYPITDNYEQLSLLIHASAIMVTLKVKEEMIAKWWLDYQNFQEMGR